MSKYNLDVKQLKRIPAPPKPPWFDAELAKLMPLNPFGESYLRVEWGMDAVQFRNGNPRAPLVIAAHEKTVKRRFRRLDPIAGAFEYFTTREEAVKAVNIRLLPTIDYMDFPEVTLYGPPRWLLTGWLAPERFGTPELWERNRYANVTLRHGKKIRLDCNGPFPDRGQWRHIWTVEGPEGEFRDLDESVMKEIRLRVLKHKRAVAAENDHTNAQELRDEVASLIAAQAAEQRRIEEEFLEDHLGPSRYRLIEGNAWSGYAGSADAQARSLKP